MSRPPPPSSVSQFSRVGRNLAKSGRILDDAKVFEDGKMSDRQLSEVAGAGGGLMRSGSWLRTSKNWP
jgi:hypothetical protein